MFDTRTQLPKAPTGIRGLDQITYGGLPRGRTTLVCGNAGCGKTLMGMEFLVRGATEFDEPGVFIAFEETVDDLVKNVDSLGFNLKALIDKKKLSIDYVRIEQSEIKEAGEFNLEGLFIRLGYAIDNIGAKRVVLDTVETVFSGLPHPSVLRAELRRLFLWLKEKGVTAIVTGESGRDSLTRYGIEEYVSDCVIMLDHRINRQLSTRRMHVVKYRGSLHGTNEYPFLIDENGITVLPVSSLNLDHVALDERISSGIFELDSMLGGQGYYRGSSILVSGMAGCGKSSMAAHFADAACRKGERCLTFLFEESPSQLIRNMRSIGLDLKQWVSRGLLRLHATRPTRYGLEIHLATMIKTIDKFQPRIVVLDPISAFWGNEKNFEIKSMLTRLVDHLKSEGITAMFLNLTADGKFIEHTDTGISSLIDTWVILRNMELDGEHIRGLYILKSRGMYHSNQVREFQITNHGIKLRDDISAKRQGLSGKDGKHE